jgi:hypothetical protein
MTSKQPGRGESPMIEQPNEGTSNASKERPAPKGNRAVPKLPPRWFVRTAWMTHRAIHRSTGGRVGPAWPKVGDKLGYQPSHTPNRSPRRHMRTEPCLASQAPCRSARWRYSSSTALGSVVSKSISFTHVGVTTILTMPS